MLADYRALKSVHEKTQQELVDMSSALEVYHQNHILEQNEIAYTLGVYKKEILDLEKALILTRQECQKVVGGFKRNHEDLFTKSRKLEKLEKDYLIIYERMQLEKSSFLDKSAIVSQSANETLGQLSKTKLILQEYKERVQECEQKMERLDNENLNLKVTNRELSMYLEKSRLETLSLHGQIDSLNVEKIQQNENLSNLVLEKDSIIEEKLEFESKYKQLEQLLSEQDGRLIESRNRQDQTLKTQGVPRTSRVLRELSALELNTKPINERGYVNRMRQLPHPATNDSQPRLLHGTTDMNNKEQTESLKNSESLEINA